MATPTKSDPTPIYILSSLLILIFLICIAVYIYDLTVFLAPSESVLIPTYIQASFRVFSTIIIATCLACCASGIIMSIYAIKKRKWIFLGIGFAILLLMIIGNSVSIYFYPVFIPVYNYFI